jgi:hypothetical protein
MPLTRSFKDTIEARAERDGAFRRALLVEAVEALLSGDVETGKALLRDTINATLGFEKLAALTGVPAKSLMRMFGPPAIRKRATCSPWLPLCRSGRRFRCPCADMDRRRPADGPNCYQNRLIANMPSTPLLASPDRKLYSMRKSQESLRNPPPTPNDVPLMSISGASTPFKVRSTVTLE